VTTLPTTPVGNYTLTITGISGCRSHSTSVTLTVTAATANFTVAASPNSQTSSFNNTTNYTVSTAGMNGFNSNVALSISGLPAGTSATLSPSSIPNGTGSSVVALTTSSSVPAGTYPLTIWGISGSLQHTATVNLVVSAIPNFALSAASPTSETVVAGGNVSYTVSSAAQNGFGAAVALSLSGLPARSSATFSPSSISGASPSTIVVTTSPETPAGTYTLTVNGTSGNLSHSTTVTLVVTGFSISATPASQTVTAGGNASYTVSTAAKNGFSGSVALSASGLPSCASASVSPTSISGAGSSTLSVTTTSSIAPGSYTLTITGTSGSFSHKTSVTLVATGFSISASPASQTVTAGGSASYTVSTAAQNGFGGSVALSASGLPSGASASFSPTSISGAGSSTLSVTTTSSVVAGSYTLTITGTTGSLSHTATVTLVVNAAGGSAGFTRVQVKPTFTGGGSSLTLGAGQGWVASTAGNAIVVACGSGGGTPAPTISDNKSDTYTLVTSVTGNTSTAILGLYVLPNNPGGITSITCTPQGYTDVFMIGMELSGAAASNVVDQFSVNDNGYNSANPWTSNATSTQNTSGDYGIGVAFEIYQGAQTFTAGSGWTGVATDSSGSIFLEEQNTVSGTSAIAATGNISNINSARVITIAATLKPSGGGSGSPNFTLSATPSSQTVTAGANTSYTVTTAAQNGFGGSVALSVSGLPSGASASFSPTSISGAGSSALSVTTTSSVAAGTYTLTVTGTSGSLSHTATVTLVVNAAGGGSGFHRVQTKSTFNSSGASSLTLGSAQGWASSTAGNAIVVACGSGGGTPAPTISDNKSDTYTLVTSVTGNTSTAILGLYVLPNNPGGVTSITCTPNSFTEEHMIAMELSGAATSNVIDRFSSNDNGFSSANPWTSNATSAQSTSGDYGIGVAYEIYQGGQTFTAGSGWTGVATDGSGSIFLEEQNTVSGTSAIAATGSISNTNSARVIAITATLKP
jgi:uncharacterized membrane protein